MSKERFTPPCEECGGKCCRYVAIQIDRPTTKREYDYIRWYLLHENMNVFIDHDRKWHIEFRTPCSAQDADNRCAIYEDRPLICKEHGNTEYECEFYDTPYKEYFSTCREFENYLNSRGVDWRYKRKS